MTPRSISADERRAWLRLARTPRVGPVTFRQLLARFGTAEAALQALPTLARRAGSKPPRPPSADQADAEIEALAARGGRLLASLEPEYPALLRAIDAPPPLISVLGSAAILSEPAVALVGARNASAIGRRFAREIAQGVGAQGYVVVSGMARGVDTAAHEGALSTGTVAVLAGGVDQIYPPENAELHERLAAEGAVVAEPPLGYPPTSRDFPRRNRLIAGLSLGVVVIEAALRSGSLITARLAGEQGREVMAAPGSPLDPRARGANGLIRDGAALIENADDVVAVLRGTRPPSLLEPSRGALFEDAVDQEALDAAVDDVRERLRELLSPTPVSRDVLVRETGASPAAVGAALVELELAGEALQAPGGLVSSLYPHDEGGDAP